MRWLVHAHVQASKRYVIACVRMIQRVPFTTPTSTEIRVLDVPRHANGEASKPLERRIQSHRIELIPLISHATHPWHIYSYLCCRSQIVEAQFARKLRLRFHGTTHSKLDTRRIGLGAESGNGGGYDSTTSPRPPPFPTSIIQTYGMLRLGKGEYMYPP